jgi:hypothetical protein
MPPKIKISTQRRASQKGKRSAPNKALDSYTTKEKNELRKAFLEAIPATAKTLNVDFPDTDFARGVHAHFMVDDGGAADGVKYPPNSGANMATETINCLRGEPWNFRSDEHTVEKFTGEDGPYLAVSWKRKRTVHPKTKLKAN